MVSTRRGSRQSVGPPRGGVKARSVVTLVDVARAVRWERDPSELLEEGWIGGVLEPGTVCLRLCPKHVAELETLVDFDKEAD